MSRGPVDKTSARGASWQQDPRSRVLLCGEGAGGGGAAHFLEISKVMGTAPARPPGTRSLPAAWGTTPSFPLLPPDHHEGPAELLVRAVSGEAAAGGPAPRRCSRRPEGGPLAVCSLTPDCPKSRGRPWWASHSNQSQPHRGPRSSDRCVPWPLGRVARKDTLGRGPVPPTYGRVSESVTVALMDACPLDAPNAPVGSSVWRSQPRRRCTEPLKSGVLEIFRT